MKKTIEEKRKYHREYEKKYRELNREKINKRKYLWAKQHPEYFRNYQRKRMRIMLDGVQNFREKMRENSKRYYWKNRIKMIAHESLIARTLEGKARRILNKAVKYGKIPKPNICQSCSKNVNRIQAHHLDYSKPLFVIWLCSTCHGFLHRK